MLHIDQKYCNLLSVRLQKFKQRSSNLWNFRCPICGDSKSNPNKTRGYIYEKKGALFFRCHNCNSGMSLGRFIKTLDPTLYKSYILDTFGHQENKDNNDDAPKRQIPSIKREKSDSVHERNLETSGCEKIHSLPGNHPAKKYLSDRRIPSRYLADLFFTSNFKNTVWHLVPSKDVSKMPEGEGRIIIPFRDHSGSLIGFQGRSLDPTEKKHKYITIKLEENNPKIWGLNHLNPSKKIYVVEGPFDAMFLHNAIATTDSALHNVIREIPGKNPHNFVLISDNEPHNSDIVREIETGIKLGYQVVIWPSRVEGLKDINDMVLHGGYSPSEIQALIDFNTYEGLMASLKIKMWRKA
jgi:hypothetical protein